jgi:hypothetical protein
MKNNFPIPIIIPILGFCPNRNTYFFNFPDRISKIICFVFQLEIGNPEFHYLLFVFSDYETIY